MTKEERCAKYTDIARKRRQKQQERATGHQPNKEIMCYQCRQTGHTVANCPSKAKDGAESETLCYKCGSTEHALSDCPKRNISERSDLPFATCFLCKEKGHLISGCPKNKKGIYVNGGSCRVCGSQQHLATVCPEKKKKKASDGGKDSDIEDLLEQEIPKVSSSKKKEPKKKRRVVKF